MKVLVVRFSSIGDIVLTSPIVRSIAKQLQGVEIHYLTKSKFVSLVNSNNDISKVIAIEKSIDEVLDGLKAEKYDHIVDLHNNVRTKSLKMKLGVPMSSFPKLNWKKWLLVKLKINRMPDIHVVERYFAAVKSLGVKNNNDGVEFKIEANNRVNVETEFDLQPKAYISVAVGAQFGTKRIPLNKLIEILSGIERPIVLMGGEMDKELAHAVLKQMKRSDIYDATGKFSLQQSASIIEQSSKILTNDTGLMHIASAFDVGIVSVWGNTVPELGMFPYRPNQSESFSIHEVKGLSCRPCSKIGFQECPKGHFKCMQNQNSAEIIRDVNLHP